MGNERERQDEFLYTLLYLPATRGYPEVTAQGAVLERKSRTAGGHLPISGPQGAGMESGEDSFFIASCSWPQD